MDNQLWLIRKIDQTKTWAKKLTNELKTKETATFKTTQPA